MVSGDKCQKNNKKLKKATGSLHPISVKYSINLGMDLIGPLPKSSMGNQYMSHTESLAISQNEQKQMLSRIKQLLTFQSFSSTVAVSQYCKRSWF